jgi:hypothetical protein
MNARSADAKGKAVETLEIEDEEARRDRLRVCFFYTKLIAATQHFHYRREYPPEAEYFIWLSATEGKQNFSGHRKERCANS